ncbi:MAG: hypothetical protein ACYTGZ_04640 [Planctomycetota bacterium]|jgi:tetratricopeptide (TPR) repeat protein
MRLPSDARLFVLALLALACVGTTAFGGVQIVEMKSGKLYEAKEVLVLGDKLRISLLTDKGDQTAIFSVPLDKVIPEHVYYAWAAQIADKDVSGHIALAEWSRKQGLFRQAWRQYVAASESSDKVMKQLPHLEQEMSEEAATWHFVQAEQSMREGDLHRARIMAERLLKDYPDSKEVARTKGLLLLLAEREQFASEQKKQEKIAARARKQRREFDKWLKEIDRAKTLVRGTKMKYVVDAKRRLRWAAYSFRRSMHKLRDLRPFIEVDDLRLSVEAVASDTEKHLVAAFTRLADLRYLTGDIPGALDAAHEVLWVDPDNKAMTDMRKRVLDGGGFRRYRYRYGYYDGTICRRLGYLPAFACPYYIRTGYGIHNTISTGPYPVGLRATRVRIGGSYSVIRYVK